MKRKRERERGQHNGQFVTQNEQIGGSRGCTTKKRAENRSRVESRRWISRLTCHTEVHVHIFRCFKDMHMDTPVCVSIWFSYDGYWAVEGSCREMKTEIIS